MSSWSDPNLQFAIQKRLAEKKALKSEEKALKKMIKLLREQATQLQVTIKETQHFFGGDRSYKTDGKQMYSI